MEVWKRRGEDERERGKTSKRGKEEWKMKEMAREPNTLMNNEFI
jgi:hypothetical protein